MSRFIVYTSGQLGIVFVMFLSWYTYSLAAESWSSKFTFCWSVIFSHPSLVMLKGGINTFDKLYTVSLYEVIAF
jgi:hypothetical protein